MEAIPIPIFYKNKQGRYLGFNHAYEVFMGRSRSELIGKSVYEIAPKELADIYHAQDLALMAQRGVQVYESRVKDGAGTLHDVMFSKACFTDHAGEVCGLIGCLLDITEQKQSERALALSEQRLNDAQRTSHVGHWELDLIAGELIWSDEIFRIFEIDKASFGASYAAFLAMIHPEDREEVSAAYTRSLETRQPYAIDHRLLLSDGRVKYVHEACETSFSDTGQPLRSRGTVQDITPRKVLENQIRQLAFYDPLTGLPNRRLLDDRLTLIMASSKRSGYCCALMFLDLDNFKPLNDAYGHAVGDLLLTEVATRLKSCVREVDTVARLGGDEFVVMLDKLSLDKADATAQSLVVAKKILTTLADPYQLLVPQSARTDHVVQHHCSASIGVAVFRDHEANQVDLLKWADAAMYKAKDAGRNTVRFHEPEAMTP
jgi:diguanylate cyclase (GGDEF)-like protein/PAS domain S-box-containing protein